MSSFSFVTNDDSFYNIFFGATSEYLFHTLLVFYIGVSKISLFFSYTLQVLTNRKILQNNVAFAENATLTEKNVVLGFFFDMGCYLQRENLLHAKRFIHEIRSLKCIGRFQRWLIFALYCWLIPNVFQWEMSPNCKYKLALRNSGFWCGLGWSIRSCLLLKCLECMLGDYPDPGFFLIICLITRTIF